MSSTAPNSYHNPSEVINPEGLSDAVERVIFDPDFSVHDYQWYASLNWKMPHLTSEAGNFLEQKLDEEIGEFQEALNDPNDGNEHVIEEYGDVSWCLYAIACNANLPLAPYIAGVLDYQSDQDKVRYTHDDFRTASIVSLSQSGVIESYKPTPFGLFRGLPYQPPEVNEADYLRESLGKITSSSRALLCNNPDVNVHFMRDCLGYTIANVWLWLGRKASERTGENVIQQVLVTNVRKVNQRTENDYAFDVKLS